MEVIGLRSWRYAKRLRALPSGAVMQKYHRGAVLFLYIDLVATVLIFFLLLLFAKYDVFFFIEISVFLFAGAVFSWPYW